MKNSIKIDCTEELVQIAKKLCSLIEAHIEELGSTRSLTLKLEQEWMDSVQAAAYLSLSVGSLRNMTSNGHIPYYKFGNRNRYRTEELRELLLSETKGERNGSN